MSPFTRWENHHESLSDIASTVEEVLGHNYECGHAFLRDLKLVVLRDLKCFAMKVIAHSLQKWKC